MKALKSFLISLMMLVGSLFMAPMLQAGTNTSAPFNGYGFTSRPSTTEWIKLTVPFYDDRGADRFLQDPSYLQFYNGSTWTRFLDLDADDESEDPWYWVDVKKTTSNVSYVECYNDYGSTKWIEPGTSWTKIKVYRSNRDAKSPTYVKIDIRNVSSYFGTRPLAFRLHAYVHDNDNDNFTADWYVDNKTNPMVVFHAGGSMHEPKITGYTIENDGRITVSANIPSWNEWDDKGSTKTNNCFNAKNVRIDSNFPQPYVPYDCNSSAAWGTFTIAPQDKAFFNYARTIYAASRRYDFQPTSSEKLSQAYSIPAYPCPQDLTATSINGRVTLSWTMIKGSSGSIEDNYHIKYRLQGSGTWNDCGVVESYDYTKTNPSVSFDIPETGQGTMNYEFVVARGKFEYTNDNLNAKTSLSINTNNVAATSFNASLDTSNEKIALTWGIDGGKFTNTYKYRLYRKVGIDGTWTQLKEFAMTDAKSFMDEAVTVCVPYYYQLRIYDGNSEYGEVGTTNAIVRPNENVGSISNLSVSKGFFNDRVSLSWKATENAGFTRFSITRRAINNQPSSEQQLIEFAASGLTQYSYDDHTSIPGQYYHYTVNAWTSCDGKNNISQALQSTGFSQPLGIVSGKIAYTGDVAVKGVSVMATGESGFVNQSINFNAETNTAIVTPCDNNDLSPNAFTFQAFVLVNDAASSGAIQSVFDAAGKYAVEIDNNQVWLSVYKGNDKDYDEYHFDSFTLERGVYYQLSVTYGLIGSTGRAVLYVDGLPRDTVEQSGVSAYTFPTDSLADNYLYFGRYWEVVGTQYFNGFMDEIRLWKNTLTAEEVAQNHDRYLSGKEVGLALYYRLDEVAGNEVFDISGRNGQFNENHGVLTGGDGNELRSTKVPDSERLAIKAVTDANGAYIINTIPYAGDGSLFTITPLLGVHRFNPTNKPLFFNQQSTSYSHIDFSDVSSFVVRGRVVYEGGNYPVVGCSFEIDERPLTRPNGDLVKTDDDGVFEITVPIGVHSVRVVKTGHSFANDGFLKDASGNDLDFNAPLTNVTFHDQTKVKLLGRVVGGVIENEKPLGFGESINNIGVQTITLESTRQAYDFSDTTSRATYVHNQGQWKKTGGLEDDATTVDYQQKDIVIHVSPITGEFVAMLYPEPYIVSTISVLQGTDKPMLDVYSSRSTIDLTSVAYPDDSYLQTEIRTWKDSSMVTNRPGVVDHWEYIEKSDTVRYNAKWTHYYQSTPTFSIQQLARATAPTSSPVDYLGEQRIEVSGENGNEREVIDLYDTTKGTYLFGKPVFQQGKVYAFRFDAYEAYTNFSGAESVTSIYPVEGGEVNIANNLQVEPKPETLELDSTGSAIYRFTAGAPNLTSASGDIFATLSLGAISYYWNMGTAPLQAWQLGEKSTGTNFMTAGPDQLTTILRDPPGSASYAYIESGTSLTSSSSNSISHNLAEEAKLTTSLGSELTTFVGLGAGVITKAETKEDVAVGLSSEQTFSSETETEITTTFTERFETSGTADYVGAAGDLFIGNSTNLLYGMTNGVKIYKGVTKGTPWATQGVYAIAPSAAIAYGQEFSTRFAFTAMELEDIMIPKWRQSIINRLLPIGTTVNTASITAPVYVSKLAPDNAHYGKWNLDKVFKDDPAFDRQNPYNGASYTIYFPATWGPAGEEITHFQDSVLWANNQINTWIEVLAQNEKEKVAMQLKGNYSFGGGASIDYSEAASSVSSYSHAFGFNLAPSLGATLGGEVMGVGMEFETSVTMTVEKSKTEGESSEESKTTGFVLAEEGTTDELTVDYGLTESGTFAFRTRGGQTSCPYEGAVYSKYLPTTELLSEATMQIEVPVISISSAPQVLNVPANRAATFTLVLENESETNTDCWYQLVVDESTNPYGAVLSIDGIGIGNGRTFMVPAGQSLVKTLTLTKGVKDTYRNIGIILQSLCEPDAIADTAYVSAEFVPACSDVLIAKPANNFILNTSSTTGDTLAITLQGFDVNFPNFGYIQLQYRPVSAPEWNTIMTFYPTSLYANAQGLKEDIGTRSAIVNAWKMPQTDGQYEIRATTASVNIVDNTIIGEPLSTYSTAAVSGYKDLSRPAVLGLPSPANGILEAGDELSVTFNEVINTGMMIKDNFTLTYRDGRPVAFDFVASTDKITFSFPADWFAELEGQTVTISVKDVYDMRGNRCVPVSWKALIHRNPLVWDDGAFTLTKEAGQVLTFKAMIKNVGNAMLSYQIVSLPAWLSVDNATGNLQPLSSKVLTFSVSQGLNIGRYADSIGVTCGNGVVEQLPLLLKVTPPRPDWSVNPARYENTMTVTGRISLEEVFQDDDSDLLAAFIGDECVGLVSPTFVESQNAYMTFLTVYGNAVHSGKTVTFKLWDASTGNIHSVLEYKKAGQNTTLRFTASGIEGNAVSPIIHNALNLIEQSIALDAGWNWFSINVVSNAPSLLSQFVDRMGATANILKSQTEYIQNPNWIGNLMSIDSSCMYIVNSSITQQLRFDGLAINPATSSVVIDEGWNWIGYTPRFTLPITEALAGLKPQVNDQIKGHKAYRIFAGEAGWIGNLNYLRPGEGYMYKSGNATRQELYYPSKRSQVYGTPLLRSSKAPVESRWAVDYRQFPDNMTLTSIVLNNDQLLNNPNIEIGAFCGDECRGTAWLQHCPTSTDYPYLGFLVVYGESNDNLVFKVFDHETGQEYKTVNDSVHFVANDIYGNPLSPYQIKLDLGVGTSETEWATVMVYPNPVSQVLHIARPWRVIDILEVIDISGRSIMREANFSNTSIDVSDLDNGLYVLRLVQGESVRVMKFTKR